MKMKFNEFIENYRNFNKYDPRSDLKEDSDLWKYLLKLTERKNIELYNVLHGLRCIGCKLELKETTLTLKPRYDDNSFIKDEEDWKYYKEENLIPYKKDISYYFKKLGTYLNNQRQKTA